MDTRFLSTVCEVITKEPLYTPKLLWVESQQEVVLIARGGNLLLEKAGSPVMVKFFHWDRKDTQPVIVLVFCIGEDSSNPLEGEAYLNPLLKQTEEILKALATQEHLSLFFFNVDLSDMVHKRVPWLPDERQNVNRAIQNMKEEVPLFRQPESNSQVEREFEEEKQYFQRKRTIQSILSS